VRNVVKLERELASGLPYPLAEASDEDLLRLGGGEAFGEFYRRHAVAVLRYCYGRTFCPHTAADVMAETFAHALESRHRFDAELGTPAAWLYGIAHHQLARIARRGAVRRRAMERIGIPRIAVDDESIERIESLVDAAAKQRMLDASLSALPDATRQALLLRIGDELPFAEVGARLGCSEGAARVRVFRGLAQLSASMDRGGDEHG